MTVSREVFDRMAATHGAHSSWAVWAQPDGTVPVGVDSLAFPETTSALLEVLTTDVVVVALNRGDGSTGTPLSTFHTSARSKDHVLGEALRATGAWGAFMTDLDATTVDSDASKVTVGTPHVEALLARVADVSGTRADASRTYVLLGSQVQKAFAFYAAHTGVPLRTVGLLHYSGLALIHAKAAYTRVTGESSEGLSQAEAYVRYVRTVLRDALPQGFDAGGSGDFARASTSRLA